MAVFLQESRRKRFNEESSPARRNSLNYSAGAAGTFSNFSVEPTTALSLAAAPSGISRTKNDSVFGPYVGQGSSLQGGVCAETKITLRAASIQTMSIGKLQFFIQN